MTKPRFKRVLLKLSGEVLMGDQQFGIDPDFVLELAKRFARDGVKVSRLARGLPAGSGLEFADELTLARALEGRSALS